MKLKPIIRRSAFVLAAILAPAFAFAQTIVGGVSNSGSFLGISFGGGGSSAGCSSTICTVGFTFIYIINSILVPLLFAFAFITLLYGIAKAYIFSVGDEAEVTKGHKIILWGIVAFAIMISIWGIVNIVANTFGLGGYYVPALPKSY